MNQNNENKIIIEIKKDIFNNKYKDKLLELSQKLKLSGFRKGHIPQTIIINRFGNDIKRHILNEMLNVKFLEYIKSENLSIFDYPEIQSESENDINYLFDLEIFVYSKINIDFTKIEITKYIFNVTENDVEKEINLLRLKYGEWSSVDDVIKFNDIVNVDLYEKKFDKKVCFIKNLNVKIDDKNYDIKNLKQILINKFKKKNYILYFFNNEIRETEFDFSKEVILFVNEIKRKIPIDINDEFMEKINYNKNEFSDIKEFMKKKLTDIGDFFVEKIKKDGMFESLILNHEVDIPKILIEKKLKEKFVKYDLNNEKHVTKEIKLNLILLAIKANFDIDVSKNEIDCYYKNMKKSEALENIKKLEKRIENEIYLEKILTIIEKNVTILYKNVTFEELINIGNLL